jgi:eukaryotic-like serine/threonine-protein kinase
MSEAAQNPASHCPECGARFQGSEGVCLACLLISATESVGKLGALGEHELLEVIGQGGMGIVYRAREAHPSREVALKALPGASTFSKEARQRFRIEAETMAQLAHPNILPVHRFGVDSDTPFFTMKLAKGGSLDQRLANYRNNWRAIASLMVTIADAVHFAHGHGVLHRDLKPANILFDELDHAYVSDFGLAKSVSTDMGMTHSTHVMGSPWYTAPELAEEGQSTATTVSDIWALGVMLYEMLVGQLPFPGETIHAVVRQTKESRVPEMPGAVPRDLRVITLKALEKSPARRYASAADLAADLRRWLAGEPIHARPVSAPRRAWLWACRHPTLAALAATFGIAVLTNAGMWVWSQDQVRQQRDAAEDNLRHSQLLNAKLLRQSTTPGRKAEALSRLRLAGNEGEVREARSEWIAASAVFDLGPATKFPPCANTPNRYRRESVSTNLEWMICLSEEHDLLLRHVETGAIKWKHVVPESTEIALTQVSDDGSRAAFLMPDRSLEVWDTVNNRLLVNTNQRSWEWLEARTYSFPKLFDLHPTKDLLAVVQADGRLAVHKLDSSPPHMTLGSPLQSTALAWHPSGDFVAIARAFNKSSTVIDVIDWQTNSLLWSYSVPFSQVWNVTWDHTGTFLALSTPGDGEVAILEETGIAALCQPASVSVEKTEFIKNTHLACSFQSSGDIRVWDIVSGATVLIYRAEARHMQVSQDGAALVTITGRGEVCRTNILSPDIVSAWQPISRVTTMTTGTRSAYSVFVSKQLPILVTRGTAHVVVWDTRTATSLVAWAVDPSETGRVSVILQETPDSPSSAWIYATRGKGVVFRRRISMSPAGKIFLGPPEAIPGTERLELLTRHPSGKGVIASDGSTLTHLTAENTAGPISLENHPLKLAFQTDPRDPLAHISRAGKFAYSRYGSLDILSLTHGTRHPFPVDLSELNLTFSPEDDVILAQSGEVTYCVHTSDWKLHGQMPRTVISSTSLDGIAITADGRLAAVENKPSGISLVTLPSCTPVIDLTITDVIFDTTGLTFSPDGGSLYVCGRRNVLLAWDIKKIRQELAKNRLDWADEKIFEESASRNNSHGNRK